MGIQFKKKGSGTIPNANDSTYEWFFLDSSDDEFKTKDDTGTIRTGTEIFGIQSALDDKVDTTLFDANTILAADTDDTPTALTVGASTFVGRKSTGNISAMTPAEARTELNVADGATANAADSFLLDRANHTGTQLASTISDFDASVRSTPLTGLSLADDSDVVATDEVLEAFGKLQAKFTNLAFPTTDLSQVNNSAVAFTSGTFALIPLMTTTVDLSDTGLVSGTFYYSAVRSGGTNSEAQFRVTVNGNNGLAFLDTLSTFNDVGSCSFSVDGLAAGTYTVTAEAAVTEPITITACELIATAIED